METNTQAGTTVPAPLLTVDDVARILGKPRSWIYFAARSGALPSIKIGQARRFDAAELAQWIASRRSGAQ